MDVAVYVTNGDPSPQPPVTKTVSITLLNKDTNAPTPWTEFVLVSNSSSNPMARFGMTDDQGIATFTDVPVGDYSLMAQFGRPLPSNYSPNQLTISLSETSESPLNFTIYETPSALESVTLKLTDKETGTPIVGAMFDYYYFDGQSYVKGNQDMGSFSTDSNGEIKFKDFIPEGQDPFMYPPDYLRGSKDTIYFVQVSAIEGYVKADGQLKVDTNNEVLVTNEKSVPVSASLKVADAITGDIIPYDPANQDTWTGLKLYKKHISGTWLEVSAPEDYKPEGSANYYALYVPGPDGTTTILNLDSGQDYGYRVGKEPTLPISYRSETFEVTPIRLDAENLVKMYPSTYSATITVHIDDFDVNGLQKNIVGNKVELYDPLGVLIREYVIGEENYQSWGYRLQTQPLLPGVYTVVYDNGEERITKTVDTTVTDYAQVYIEVYPKPIEVNVNKMDAISKEPLAGAQFALYRWLPPTHISPMIARMATTTPMYTTILYDGKLWQLLDVYVTDVNGHFTAPITLPVLHDNGANLIPRYTTPEYLLVEIASPEGYVYDANAKIPIDPRKGSQVFDVENRPVKTDIYAEKNWSDGQDGKPGVSLQLSRSIANDAPEVLGTGIASADNNWQVVWKDMPIYDESGNEYGYTIKEVDIPAGYTASAPTGSGTLADPFVITNTSIVDTKPTPDPGTTTPGSPSTEPRYGIIKGEKTWFGDKAIDRPKEITVQLINKVTKEVVQTTTSTEKEEWTYRFRNVLLEDEKGNRINYEVKEVVPQGYEASYSGFDIKNTKIDPLAEYRTISGVKIWKNDQEGDRPNKLEIRLIDKKSGVIVEKTEATKETGWTYRFENILVKDSKGKDYYYRVEEVVPAGYEVSYDGYTITNTKIKPVVKDDGKKPIAEPVKSALNTVSDTLAKQNPKTLVAGYGLQVVVIAAVALGAIVTNRRRKK